MKNLKLSSFSILFTAAMLTACGGGGGSGSGGENSAPVFSAPTPATALEDQAFSLALSATDTDGDTLTYSATGLPEWLSINASTGLLSGTPERQDVGITQGITLTVSDGEASANTSLDLEVIQTETLTVFGSVSNVDLPNAEISVSFVVPQFAAPQNNKSQLTTKLGFSQKNKLTSQDATSEKIVDTTITTSSDENGNFQFDVLLISGEFTGEELVEITARGVGDQDNIELLSQVGDIDFLLESAGDDFQLTVDELSRINISPLSTALALRARDRNNNVLSQDWDEIQALEFGLSAEEILSLANNIFLLTELNALYESGATLLEAFTVDAASIENILNEVFQFNGFLNSDNNLLPEIKNLLEEIEQSRINVISFNSANMSKFVDRSVLFTTPFVVGSHPSVSASAADFNSDGTGVFYNKFIGESESSPIEWRLTSEGRLIINGAGGSIVDNARLRVVDLELDSEIENFLANNGIFGNIVVELDFIDEFVELELISINEASITTNIVHTQTVAIDTLLLSFGYVGDLPRINRIGNLNGTNTILESKIDFSESDFSEQSWVIPAQENFGELIGNGVGLDDLTHDLYFFNADGTTNLSLLGGESARWSINDGSLEFSTLENNIKLTPLIETQDDIYVIAERELIDGTRSVTPGYLTKQIDSDVNAFSEDFILPQITESQGLFWFSGRHFIFSPEDFSDTNVINFLRLFGYAFTTNENNFVSRLVSNIFSNEERDRCLSRDDFQCIEVIDRRRIDVDGNRITLTEVDSIDPSGITRRERIWDIINYNAELKRAVVLERVFLEADGLSGNVLIPPRINVLQVIDLAIDYPEEYADQPTIFNQ
ncbi:hypothetical protein MAH1_13250 [Sessilibacter sp. MAH1]